MRKSDKFAETKEIFAGILTFSKNFMMIKEKMMAFGCSHLIKEIKLLEEYF